MAEINAELTAQVAKDFQAGLNCSQVAFSYAARKLGLDEVTAKKIGSGFGGGMMNGERCGAVTGALMGLGLKYGHSSAEDKPKEAELMEKKAEFEKKFLEKYPSLQCQEIIGANVGTPEGRKRFKEENLAKDCPALTAYVCQILEELL